MYIIYKYINIFNKYKYIIYKLCMKLYTILTKLYNTYNFNNFIHFILF